MADDRLSSSLDVTCPEMPITKRSLIDLPEDYTDLLNKATAYECPNWSTDRKSKSFAICLTCGDLVCYEVKLNYGFTLCNIKMFLKPVWVGKIHRVEVYATHVVRIWWFSNKFSIFQLKRM